MRPKILTGAAFVLAAALAGATPTSAGPAAPGIDLLVRKLPNGKPVVVAVAAADLNLDGQLKLPKGTYQAWTACRSAGKCPAHRINVLVVSGAPVSPNAAGDYVFPVGSSVGTLTTFRGAVSLVK